MTAGTRRPPSAYDEAFVNGPVLFLFIMQVEMETFE
jgi:hypothetical protein